MTRTWRGVPLVCWICGVLLVAGLALAGMAWMLGMESESVKVFLLAFFAPGFLLMASLLVAILRIPRWFRDGQLVAGVLFSAGASLFTASLATWLPWSPDRSWRVGEMPLVLEILLGLGLVLTVAGMVMGALREMTSSSKRRTD